MATHLICQPTEPLPHKYPVVRKSEKGHGAVSHYEVFNLGDKPYTNFPPVGWDTSQSSEESIPLCQAPTPAWSIKSSFIGPDPDLCITPEKHLASQKQGQKRNVCPKPTQHNIVHPVGPDPELCITPEKSLERIKPKTQHRVRFDVDNYETTDHCKEQNPQDLTNSILNTSGGGKAYKPDIYYSNDNIDSESTEKQSKIEYSKSKQYINNVNENPTFLALKDHGLQNMVEDEPKLGAAMFPVVQPSGQIDSQMHDGRIVTVSKSKTKNTKQTASEQTSDNATIESISKNSHSGPKRRVRVTREIKERPIQTEYKFPFSEEGGGSVLESEHVFNRPEYNSTLRMRRELEEIKDSQVDVARALERKLNMSETKQSEIREKAATKVNCAEDNVKFSGLVSLSVPINSICTQLEKEKTSRVRPSKHLKPQVSKAGREPDLMEFFTADLQKETAEFSLPGLSAPSESLSTASHRTAFDLYRHNRVWNCTSHFRSGK